MLERNILFFRLCYTVLQYTGKALQYVVLNNRYQIQFVIKNSAFRQSITIFNKHSFFLFKTISDIVGIDYPNLALRFRLVYVLLSYAHTLRCLVTTHAKERLAVSSLTFLYPGCGWLEREVWDLFGVYFQGNRDLRRILTDYGFSGYPLRKDFPLTGFHEVVFDDRKQQVIYQPVSLAQEYRDFTHQNPWLTHKK